MRCRSKRVVAILIGKIENRSEDGVDEQTAAAGGGDEAAAHRETRHAASLEPLAAAPLGPPTPPTIPRLPHRTPTSITSVPPRFPFSLVLAFFTVYTK